VTHAELENFRLLREEQREGFREVKEAIGDLGCRVSSLELTRAADEAIRTDRRLSAKRMETERRWRIGVTAGVLASVGVGFLNFFLNLPA